ncbi:MAG: phosphoenolpyruvate--protein phosphotransferase [Planctomycetota bacterium]|nr:phosphoenolpyruvate--protein phosphotransferase [Planctomycetota bacterium]MCX8039668.1 phosphoenolpyruvate--protein phosphotransferase [Planctomycetota bacterium]MDW8372246.1 phosphoenolpyruvate--protein phosphotransferase [Planctomycetota bacterium]
MAKEPGRDTRRIPTEQWHQKTGEPRTVREVPGDEVSARRRVRMSGEHAVPTARAPAAEQRPESSGTVNRRRKTMFKGIPVVPGVAIGVARIKFRRTQLLSDRRIEPHEVPREIERFNEAVRLSKEQLLESRVKVAAEIGEVEAMIFDAHIAILDDKGFINKVRAVLARDLRPIEVVVGSVVEGYYKAISELTDDHLRERATDIRDVGRRLLDNLARLSAPPSASPPSDTGGSDDEIICAHELLPSDLVTLEHRRCKAIVCELGSDRGHAAIMLRAIGMPSVMGVSGLLEHLADGDTVIVDASSGVVFLDPRPDVLDSYRKTLREQESYKRELAAEAALPSVTTDGRRIHLLANVNKLAEIDLARQYHIDGVGLYRSEFHLMVGPDYPDEEEQYQIYRRAIERMHGLPLTLRTMDLGADKKLPCMRISDDAHVLGRRSIRLISELEEYQLIQLRAMLRASAHGRLRLMFPFITTLEDIRYAKKLIRTAKRELDERGALYDPDIPIGMMVEVPAVALSLDKYAREVQFFSVGTNDLTQYVCAADRNLASVAPWYKPHNPGMLWLLKHIVDSARACQVELTVCGEMAGDPFYTMFLLGIGVERLSMAAPQIPIVKKIVRSVNIPGAQNLARRALQLTSTSQIRELFTATVQQILGRDLSGWAIMDPETEHLPIPGRP